MAAFMHVRQEKLYMKRKTCRPGKYCAFYRFDEENVQWISDHFVPYSEETRGGRLCGKEQMEIFLRYLADPGHQLGVGEDKGVHQTTVSKTFSKVLSHVIEKADLWIKFPVTIADVHHAQQLWQEEKQIPGTVGALDCTHVQILKPGIRGGHGDEYINRKGAASINVQATCDAKERFTSVDANWPGSVHDSRILKNSHVAVTMVNSRHRGLLLGDEGYAIAPWLLTPYKNPLLPAERTFNNIHARERVVIERCFGQLKKRFPILQGRVRLALHKVPSVIVACIMLHNVAKYLNDPHDNFPEFDEDSDSEDDDDDDDEDVDRRIRQRGQDKRRAIADFLNNAQD
ncbi:putative nuclease HARBI1 [Lineus longissimus]|uniref:putative nuclease HARBI1 n=1 Tax=Lineus longissimus TaxID=88925 RepID=UPI00315C5A96